MTAGATDAEPTPEPTSEQVPEPGTGAGEAVPAGGSRIEAWAARLVAGLAARPWGQVSVSVYETGRVTTLAPWLAGRAERLAHLAAVQRADGGWGGPGGYSLVPTLSATEALLAALRHGDIDDRETVVKAAGRGLHALFRGLPGTEPATALPDMPAIELITPALVELINGHLDALTADGVAGFDPWRGDARLRPPTGIDAAPLDLVRALVRSGRPLPDKLLHALEIGGEAATRAPAVRPLPPGTVGASPAATAAWLGAEPPDPDEPARRYLEEVARLHGGPVPCGMPVTVFEQGWVLSWLARAGIRITAPPDRLSVLMDGLAQADRPGGTAAGPGLPADADTTSVALYALALLGSPRPPDALEAYRTERGFCTWQGEQGFSVTVNAHVLDAIGQYVACRPEAAPAYADVLREVSEVLCERQADDGRWLDRWHASPYYATASCAWALAEFGTGADGSGGAGGTTDRARAPEIDRALRRAVRWVLDTQRPDGSWGVWGGTAEETAYALQILLLDRSAEPDAARASAVERGRARLLRAQEWDDGPAMWHDKDLYRPVGIVRAAVLAASHLSGIRL